MSGGLANGILRFNDCLKAKGDKRDEKRRGREGKRRKRRIRREKEAVYAHRLRPAYPFNLELSDLIL